MLLNTGCIVLGCCVLELGCGSAGVVSGLPAEAQLLCFSRQPDC